MPRAPAKECAEPTCHRRIQHGRSRCRKHGGPLTPRIRPAYASVYGSTAWKKLSAQVLAEEPICRLCGVNPSELPDHIVELADGGAPLERSNLQGACTACNVSKGQRAAQARRRGQGGHRSR